MLKKTGIISIILALVILMSACGAQTAPAEANGKQSGEGILQQELFESTPAPANAVPDAEYIRQTGEYTFEGTLEKPIIVDAPKDAVVKIILNGCDISVDGFACIYALSADEVIVSAAEGTDNRLKSSGDFAQIDASKVDGAVFSKTDLQISGHGRITVECEKGHGIVAKDDLNIKNLELSVKSCKKGIQVNEKCVIKSGAVGISSGTDGIAALGLDIKGGNIDIVSGGNGIKAAPGKNSTSDGSNSYLRVSGGEITVKSTGDGIDSKGIIEISGGKISVAMPEKDGAVCVKYKTGFTKNGGILETADGSGK